jgi:hypothetical protein
MKAGEIMQERINYPRKLPQTNWKGRVQGRLTFGKPSHFMTNASGAGGYWYYHVKCECGKKTVIAARKSTMSCGCLRVEACLAAKEMKVGRREEEKNERERRLKFDSSICMRLYPCDKRQSRWKHLPPPCFGKGCYENERLAIGYNKERDCRISDILGV